MSNNCQYYNSAFHHLLTSSLTHIRPLTLFTTYFKNLQSALKLADKLLHFMNINLNVSNFKHGLISPVESVITPESCTSLLLRSSSLSLQDWELRAEARSSQLLHDRLQPLSLKRNQNWNWTQLASRQTFTPTWTHWYMHISYVHKRDWSREHKSCKSELQNYKLFE